MKRLALCLVWAALAACSSSSNGDSGNPADGGGNTDSGSPSDAGGQTVAVQVGSGGQLSFSPAAVTIHVGDTVQWTFASSGHTVTSGSGCGADNKFCSPNDTNCGNGATSASGATYSHTFTTAGTFPYFCEIHCGSGMTGTVTVQ
jgi:plastocyanin